MPTTITAIPDHTTITTTTTTGTSTTTATTATTAITTLLTTTASTPNSTSTIDREIATATLPLSPQLLLPLDLLHHYCYY